MKEKFGISGTGNTDNNEALPVAKLLTEKTDSCWE